MPFGRSVTQNLRYWLSVITGGGIPYFDATGAENVLPFGPDGTVLTADSSAPDKMVWQAAAGTGGFGTAFGAYFGDD